MKKHAINLHISSKLFTFAHRKINRSGFGAVGSAHVWGARGRWFESSNPDFVKEKADNHWGVSLFPYSAL